MSGAGQNIKDVIEESAEIVSALMSAVTKLTSIFGWTKKRAVSALADHMDPAKPENPQVAAALDSGKPDPKSAA